MAITPRVAAIHDISGFGRCSMTIVLPVLAAMGMQCCPLPTAYLSAHTAFPASDQAAFTDLTGQMEATACHWEELGASFQGIYCGFLGSAEQIGILSRLIDRFRAPDTLVVVDPVMGDYGVAYRTYTPEMCARMGSLAAKADIITPNLTEAALLLGESYSAVPADEPGMRAWLERLSLGGKRSVVITGASFQPGQVGAATLDRATGGVHFAFAPQEPGQFPGTGDLFTSVLMGSVLQGHDLAFSAARAVDFVGRCAASTIAGHAPVLEGVQFEPLLGELTR